MKATSAPLTKKTKSGIVVSDKMSETAVVEVTIWKIHRLLKKRYQRHHRFQAHNPENKYKTGDKVEMVETKPMSRHKRFLIVGITGEVAVAPKKEKGAK